MKKIIVIGCPGSGKSTLARELHRILRLPLFYLDTMFWNADKTTVDRSVLIKRELAAMRGHEWIIDGNYISTMDIRLAECDTVIFLDFPAEVCICGVLSRMGKPRPDMPWVETEPDGDFLEYVRGFSESVRPAILTYLSEYPEKNLITLRSRNEVSAFISELEKEINN